MSKRSLTFPAKVCKGATGDVSERDVYLFSFSFYEKQASDRLIGCLILLMVINFHGTIPFKK